MSMRTQVRFVTSIDTAAVQDWIATAVGASVQRAAGAVRDHAKDNLTAAGRVDTGTLRRAVTAETAVVRGNSVVARVVSEQPYAKFVHDGTTGPILPRRARVLRFTPRGGPVVYAPSVRGIEPTPYLTDALRQLRNADFL